MSPIHFASNSAASLSPLSDLRGQGGDGAGRSFQPSPADTLSSLFSPADALRAAFDGNASESADKPDNFEVQGADHSTNADDLADAVNREAEKLKKVAEALKDADTDGGFGAFAATLFGADPGQQQDASLVGRTNVPSETPNALSPWSSTITQASYHSEPDKYISKG